MQCLSSEDNAIAAAPGLVTRSRMKMKRPEPPENMVDNSSSSGTSTDGNGITLLIRACEISVGKGQVPAPAPEDANGQPDDSSGQPDDSSDQPEDPSGQPKDPSRPPVAVASPSKVPASQSKGQAPQKVLKTKLENMSIISYEVIKTMSSKKMIECFTSSESNEFTRKHKITCMLMPESCQHEITSYGSELSAEKQMMKHLEEHRKELVKQAEDPDRNSEFQFFAVPMQAKTASLGTRFTRTSPKNGRKENMNGTKKKTAKTSETKSPASTESENSSSPEVLRENASTRKRKSKDGEGKKDGDSKKPKTDKRASKKKGALPVPMKTEENILILHDHCYTTESGKSAAFLAYEPPAEVPEGPRDPGPVPILPLNIPTFNLHELPMVSEEVILGSEPTTPSIVTTREEPVPGPSHAVNGRNARQAKLPRKRGKATQPRVTRRAPAPLIDPEIKDRALQLLEELKNRPKAGKGPVVLVCKICQNTFTAAASLTYHYRGHAGLKLFKCQICFVTFTRQHSLNYHIMTHSGKTRFSCTHCDKKFRHPNHFKEHLRKHTGETPFECGDCHMKFKTRNTYKRHLKTRHGKILTAKGIHTLPPEEFQKVRTKPYKTFQSEDDSSRKADNEKVIMKKRAKKPDTSGDSASAPAPAMPAPVKVCLEMQAPTGKPSRVA